VWEVAAEGGAPRQITHCERDCLLPAYLPGGGIVYTAVRGKGAERTSEIYVAQGDGAQAQAITFGPGDYQVETVLQSGRVLISAKWPLLPGPYSAGDRRLYVLRPDGSGMRSLRDDRQLGVRRGAATELADNTILFEQKARGARGSAGGELEWIQQGHLHAARLRGVAALCDGAAQISATGFVVAEREPGAAQHFGLYLLEADGKGDSRRIYGAPRLSAVQPVAVEPHREPLIYPSILHPATPSGRMLCLNAYLSKDVPGGRLAGDIATVRVIALLGKDNQQKVLGEAPVEKDGSFYATVPANTPIRFELIGRTGRVLHAQRGWIWTRNGEDRACVGCHESHALAPANHSPMVLQRFDMPIALGIPSATRKSAQQ
jgi:hypothetical protein